MASETEMTEDEIAAATLWSSEWKEKFVQLHELPEEWRLSERGKPSQLAVCDEDGDPKVKHEGFYFGTMTTEVGMNETATRVDIVLHTGKAIALTRDTRVKIDGKVVIEPETA